MKRKLKTSCSFCGIKDNDPKCKYIIETEDGKAAICEDCVFTCIRLIQSELRAIKFEVEATIESPEDKA